MSAAMPRVLIWAPRVFCIFFAIFLALFALDVFEGGRGFWLTAAALVMHLIPSALVLVVLAVSWRYELVGATAFLALAAFYLAMTWGRLNWTALIAISGPLVVVAGLFFLSWSSRRRPPADQ